MNTKLKLILQAAIMLLTLIMTAWWMGGQTAQGQSLPMLLAVGLLALALLLPSPIRGLYAAYFLLWLIPFGILRLDFPLFRSPLNMVALLTAGLAAARAVVLGRRLPSSPLYVPLGVCLLVLGIYTIAGHGPNTGSYLEIIIKGVWPFFMIVLLVDTPRQARMVLIVGASALLLQALLVLPSQVAQVIAILQGDLPATGSALRVAGAPAEAGGKLPSLLGRFSWQTMTAYALATPVFLALVLAAPRKQVWARRLGMLGFAVLASSVILGGYVMSAVTLVLGVAALLWIIGRSRQWRRGEWLGRAIPILLLVLALIRYTPGGEVALSRTVDFKGDPSISGRLGVVPEVASAFLESPLFGWGWYNRAFYTPGGGFVDVHAGVLFLFASLGLLFMVPLGLLLWQVWGGLARLSRQPLSPLEQALIAGFKGSYILYIAVLILGSRSLGDIGQDFIMWSMIGLATVWSHWLKSGRHDRLVG